MKAEELRLGNYVWNDVQNCPVQVNLKILMEQYYREIEGNGLWEPIKITEDWLIKFGFCRFPGRRYIFDISGFWGCKFIDDGLYFPDLEHIINYVHELQNLHYALTGTELLLKEG